MTVPWEKWDKSYVVAEIWDCGDEECDCIQPVINRATPNRTAGYPWIKWERLWEGTFVTQGGIWGGMPEGVTYETLVEDLRAATAEYPEAEWRVSQ